MLNFPNSYNEESFEILSHGVTLTFERLDLPSFVAFRVKFSSERKPLVVARATNADLDKFWTSIPEGRQREAEGVGKLIDEYFEKKS